MVGIGLLVGLGVIDSCIGQGISSRRVGGDSNRFLVQQRWDSEKKDESAGFVRLNPVAGREGVRRRLSPLEPHPDVGVDTQRGFDPTGLGTVNGSHFSDSEFL